MSIKGQDLLEKIRHDFIGLDTEYETVDGKKSRRIYLDTTASLNDGVAHRSSNDFLKHYSNTHSLLHFSAKISTKTYHWIHNRILDFVHADLMNLHVFYGQRCDSRYESYGKTLNRIRPERDMVLVSIMEHHSNDLPHRKHGGKVMHIPINKNNTNMGGIDMEIFEKYLIQFQDRINYVSIMV